jgi:hypothetical protein
VATTPTTPAAPTQSEGEAEEAELVPISLDLYESLHGFSLGATSDPADPEQAAVDVDFKIDRAGSTVFFATFVMLLMWCLAIGAVSLMLWVTVGGRKIELAMFSFLGALLFAFPAVRNAVPGSPPIGAFSDYLAFFWAEGLVATSLIVILAAWALRPQR